VSNHINSTQVAQSRVLIRPMIPLVQATVVGEAHQLGRTLPGIRHTPRALSRTVLHTTPTTDSTCATLCHDQLILMTPPVKLISSLVVVHDWTIEKPSLRCPRPSQTVPYSLLRRTNAMMHRELRPLTWSRSKEHRQTGLVGITTAPYMQPSEEPPHPKTSDPSYLHDRPGVAT